MIASIKSRGFTIIEILFAVAVLVLITAIIIVSWSKLNASQALEKSTASVASVLDEARSLTLSAVGDSQYGVNLQESQLVLFKGDTYLPSDSDNRVTELHSAVGIRNISLSGGGVSVVFKRLTGSTDQYGTVELYLRLATTTKRLINIRATGVIEIGL